MDGLIGVLGLLFLVGIAVLMFKMFRRGLSLAAKVASAHSTFVPPKEISDAERAPNEHVLPAEIQQLLPPGTRVLSYDGELVYRTTIHATDTHLIDFRQFSLTPLPDPKMYARRWDGEPVKDTYLTIEPFHGHRVTMYFLYLPKKDTVTTGAYRTASFAVVSLRTDQWIWVTVPKAVELIFEGGISGRMVTELLNVAAPGGYAKRLEKNNQYAAALDQVVMHLRFEFERKKELERAATSRGRI